MLSRTRIFRGIRRWSRRNKNLRWIAAVVVILVGGLMYTEYVQNRQLSVDKSSLQPLLSLIAEAESNANYNAYFGNSANQKTRFTKMSIKQVRQWQSEYVQQGSPSSAVGKYQIIDSTLGGLVDELDIDESQKFDESTQDRMAIALLERRGVKQYVNNELPAEEFAASLAKEWASLPRVVGQEPDKSYYASDGLNKSSVKVDELLEAVKKVGPAE